jgi:hypothetical protein
MEPAAQGAAVARMAAPAVPAALGLRRSEEMAGSYSWVLRSVRHYPMAGLHQLWAAAVKAYLLVEQAGLAVLRLRLAPSAVAPAEQAVQEIGAEMVGP